ncbi:MAG: AbrB/MazE/SpoVT family DNA-binding domain-containing protein [Gammaproteobacteria bacterium]|nr:AbrB/MazE/SpoVT family DNA-binding domain-containing protein [Gammaproteobacteria bacterium]
MNATLAITAKGQITLPKEILAHLGARPGDRLVVEML